LYHEQLTTEICGIVGAGNHSLEWL